MNESKVVTGTVSLFDYQFLWEKFKAALDARDKAHADYRELEEINRQLVGKSNRLTILTARLEEELASIKARVGELVGAAENTLAVEKRYGLGGSASDRLSSALEAFK